MIAVFVLQLVPLPPGIWSVLPGRDTVAQFYTVAGMALPWQPLSLSPGETWRAGLALLPALALFLATLTLSRAERQVLLVVAVVIGLISVPLGILQVLGGDESELYFFQYTNPGSAVGFFANANHYAAFCYMLIPLSAALLSEPPRGEGRSRRWRFSPASYSPSCSASCCRARAAPCCWASCPCSRHSH